MKHKILAMMLALTVISWAQTETQATPSTPQQSTTPAEKAKCACCDKMAASNAKGDHAACTRHGHGDAKEMASCCAGKDEKSCCGGKDAKSCMKGEKSAGSCCKEGCNKEMKASCCDHKGGKQCGKDCCGSNKSEKTAQLQ